MILIHNAAPSDSRYSLSLRLNRFARCSAPLQEQTKHTQKEQTNKIIKNIKNGLQKAAEIQSDTAARGT